MNMFIRNEIKARAKLSRGLLNILKDDIETLNADVDSLNLFNIEESIRETKDTLTDIMENMIHLESAIATLKRMKK